MSWFKFWKKSFEEKPMRHIAVVFPATFPSLSISVPEPNAHCTIMYLGTTDKVNFTPDDVKAGLANLKVPEMLWARVTVPEMFGPDKNVPVLRVEHNLLDVVNGRVTAALNKVGIVDPSEYADTYKPHVTVSQTTYETPPHAVLLTKPQLWWAGERMSLDN